MTPDVVKSTNISRPYFECHITIQYDLMDFMVLKKEQNAVKEIGWLFSHIDGDPDLGPGTRCYATRQFNVKDGLMESIIEKLTDAANKLRARGIVVIREKIEYVFYDKRSKAT